MPETLTRQADIRSKSVDAKARTVSVIWSTGAAVDRRDFEGPFTERVRLGNG